MFCLLRRSGEINTGIIRDAASLRFETLLLLATMNSNLTDAKIRNWAWQHRLPQTHLSKWLALGESDRSAMLNLTETLRLRTGQFVSAFEMLQETAVREHQTIAEIVARPALQRTINGVGSAPGRASRFLDELRAIRFPRLTETTNRLKAEIAALGLPREIAVALPHDLGSDELKIEITAHSAAELKMAIETLANNAGKLARIAEMLGGSGEL